MSVCSPLWMETHEDNEHASALVRGASCRGPGRHRGSRCVRQRHRRSRRHHGRTFLSGHGGEGLHAEGVHVGRLHLARQHRCLRGGHRGQGPGRRVRLERGGAGQAAPDPGDERVRPAGHRRVVRAAAGEERCAPAVGQGASARPGRCLRHLLGTQLGPDQHVRDPQVGRIDRMALGQRRRLRAAHDVERVLRSLRRSRGEGSDVGDRRRPLVHLVVLLGQRHL